MRLLRGLFALALAAGLVLAVGIGPHSALAAEVEVGVNYDCSRDGLSIAIGDAVSSDIITFACSNPTIDFLNGDQIEIDKSITIDGSNQAGSPIILDGNDATRFFDVLAGGHLTLRHMTLYDGSGGGFGGAIRVQEHGSANIEHVTFDSNRVASYQGGAIFARGDLVVRHSIFTNNTSDLGGAIGTYPSSTLSISDSRFENNVADFHGGAIDSDSDAVTTIVRSTFINNAAANRGGAINHEGSVLNVLASTFSNNAANVVGSTIYVDDQTTSTKIAWSTIIQMSDAGSEAIDINQHVELIGVILGGVGDRCAVQSPSLLTDSYTLAIGNGCSLDGVGSNEGVVDLGIGPLSTTMIEGVPQSFRPLLQDSPAVNGGSEACDPAIQPGPDTDQLGNPRPQHVYCDIGAIESSFTSGLLCANRWNGALGMIAPQGCGRGEAVLNIKLDAPIALCVNNWNGATRASDNCGRSEHPVLVYGDHSVGICVNNWNDRIRVSDRCSRSEHADTL